MEVNLPPKDFYIGAGTPSCWRPNTTAMSITVDFGKGAFPDNRHRFGTVFLARFVAGVLVVAQTVGIIWKVWENVFNRSLIFLDSIGPESEGLSGSWTRTKFDEKHPGLIYIAISKKPSTEFGASPLLLKKCSLHCRSWQLIMEMCIRDFRHLFSLR